MTPDPVSGAIDDALPRKEDKGVSYLRNPMDAYRS